VSVWHDLRGEGPPVVLLHAGIADSRLWEPQLRSFPQCHSVLRVDLPGFGNSPLDTNPVSLRGAVRDAMDAEGIDRAAVVGVSLGGNTALELALESPELVSALVLVGAGLPDHEWSEEGRPLRGRRSSARTGNLEAAVDANLRMWFAGPRRSLDDMDPALRELVGEMQRQAFRQQKGHDDVRLLRLDPPASERLGDVNAPALVLTGDDDVGDIHRIARSSRRRNSRCGARDDRGRRASPEPRPPEEFDRIVLDFLARHGV